MLAVLFLAVATTAAPAPQATPQLKVIVNVKSSSLCTTLQQTAVPIAYVAHRNEQAFDAINHSMIKFMENTRGVTSAGAAELQAMDNALDDAEIYTPSSELTVIQMDKIAYEIAQNLVLEDHVMDASWKEYPRGQFPNVDALRQRLQNLMDLQRALDNRYFSFTGIYLDNRGQAAFAGNAAAFKALLRDEILGLSSALSDVSSDGGDPEVAAKASVHDVARYGSVASVVKELRLQTYAFAKELTTAGKTCGLLNP
jgi:hypothetical protein